jgi:hypothetical protein
MTKKKQGKKQIEKRMDDFSEEVSEIAQRLGKNTRAKKEDTVGIIGPIIKTVIGIIFLAILIWLLNALNVYLLSVFVSSLTAFLYANIGLLFIANLLFNYADNFSKDYNFRCLFWPLIASIKAVFILWILTSILLFVGGYTNISVISSMSRFVYNNLFGIFSIALLIGYIARFACCLRECKCCLK